MQKKSSTFVSKKIYKLSQLGVVPTRKLESTFASKSAKLAKPDPPELSPNASELVVILGACEWWDKKRKSWNVHNRAMIAYLNWPWWGWSWRRLLGFLGRQSRTRGFGSGWWPSFRWAQRTAGSRCVSGRGVQDCKRIAPKAVFAGLLSCSSAIVKRIAGTGTGTTECIGFIVEGGLESTIEPVIKATVRLECVRKAVRLESVRGESIRRSRRRWVLLRFLLELNYLFFFFWLTRTRKFSHIFK